MRRLRRPRYTTPSRTTIADKLISKDDLLRPYGDSKYCQVATLRCWRGGARTEPWPLPRGVVGIAALHGGSVNDNLVAPA